MPRASAVEYEDGHQPGPNDYYVVEGEEGERPKLLPGLGPDEPSPESKTRLRQAGERRLEALKKELAKETEKMSEREQEIERREHALALKEAKLLARLAGPNAGPSKPKPTRDAPEDEDE